MSRRVDSLKYLFLIIIVFIATCGSGDNKKIGGEIKEREKSILNQYSSMTEVKYADLLVDIKKYTTNGARYHKKYFKYLIGIAADITENKSLKIVEGSVGFYYDKKSSYRNMLFLGLDIETGIYNKSSTYNKTALKLLKMHIKSVIGTINSCMTIFREREIRGMVIGFRWRSEKGNEAVNIWINESDVIKFEKDMLTFYELIQRSSITDTIGGIIKLPI